MGPLRVEAKFKTQPVHISMPCMIEVQVTNISDDPVFIIKRLAIGYPGSFDRELFVEMFRRGENEVVSRETQLYERNPPSHSDYIWLAPGEAVSTTFDLFDWYKLPGAGEYDLVLSYRADDSPDGHPKELLTGIHSSARTTFAVLP